MSQNSLSFKTYFADELQVLYKKGRGREWNNKLQPKMILVGVLMSLFVLSLLNYFGLIKKTWNQDKKGQQNQNLFQNFSCFKISDEPTIVIIILIQNLAW